MVNKNGTTDSFWKIVKIKELPVKEEVDRRSVLLIENDQDTKQMSVDIFYKAIEDAADKMLEMIRAKLVEVESFMEEMRKMNNMLLMKLNAKRMKSREYRTNKNEENNLKNGFVYGKRCGLHSITKL